MTPSQHRGAVALSLVGGLATCAGVGMIPFVQLLAPLAAVIALPWMLNAALKQIGNPGPGDLKAAATLLGWVVLSGSILLGGAVAGWLLPSLNPDHPPGRSPSVPFIWELAPIGAGVGIVLGLIGMIIVRTISNRIANSSKPASTS